MASLKLSVELPLRQGSDIPIAVKLIKQMGSRYTYSIPYHSSSPIDPVAAAEGLSKEAGTFIYTQVCRGNTLDSIRKELREVAAIKNIKTVLVVTGDNAERTAPEVSDVIKAIDKKRFSAAAALVFTRKNESARAAKKIRAGAKTFYTQPVFPGNTGKLIGLLHKMPWCNVHVGVLIPFPAAACRKMASEKPDFISDGSFIRELAAAEKEGKAYEATVKLARQNIAAAMIVARAAEISGIHFYGLAARKFGSKLVSASELLRAVVAGMREIKAQV